MSKRKNKSSKRSSSKNKAGDDTYALQAIILADSYIHKRFRPISLECPKMLLPLVGCPMINYVIDLLVNSNVNEIYIICSSHAEQIENYIATSQWKNVRNFPKLAINIVRIDDCKTVGDALRYMHTLNYIQSKTFILCRGDCVANMSLTTMIHKHQQRYKNCTSTLMTCLFKKVKHKQRATSLEDDLFIVTNNNQLLHYENERSNSLFSFDLSILDEYDEVEINHNIIDCGIDICSKSVLSLFEDNFDYEYIRKEFFEGVIRSELYNYKIYAHFLDDREYATRVMDWKTYHGVSCDIIERWTYPLTLSSNTVSHNYSFERNNIYKEDNVKIGYSSKIIKNTVLGFNTQIGDQCQITKCVIGPNCVIGNNVILDNCYLFENITIHDNCKLNGVVIANDVNIGKNCLLPGGCIISYGVCISDNISLQPYTKVVLSEIYTKRTISIQIDDGFGSDGGDVLGPALPNINALQLSSKNSTRRSSDASDRKTTIAELLNNDSLQSNDDDNSNVGMANGINGIHQKDLDEKGDEDGTILFESIADIKYDILVVGKNGKGFLYEIPNTDESYIPNQINCVLSNESNRIPRGYSVEDDLLKQQQNLHKTESSQSNGLAPPLNGEIGKNDSKMDNDNDNEHENMEKKLSRKQIKKLTSEISDCIANAEKNQSIDLENVVFEISTSVRLANHASLNDFSLCVFGSLLSRIRDDLKLSEKQEQITMFIEKYSCLFTKLTKKIDVQIIVIQGLYDACIKRNNGLIAFFLEGLETLYYDDDDIISLEAVQQWISNRNKSDNKTFEKFLSTYIERFENESDDDDDDDSDSD